MGWNNFVINKNHINFADADRQAEARSRAKREGQQT